MYGRKLFFKEIHKPITSKIKCRKIYNRLIAKVFKIIFDIKARNLIISLLEKKKEIKIFMQSIL